jgi:hypothetical protein
MASREDMDGHELIIAELTTVRKIKNILAVHGVK